MRARLVPYGPAQALPWSSVSSSIMKCVSLQQLVMATQGFFLSPLLPSTQDCMTTHEKLFRRLTEKGAKSNKSVWLSI